MKISPVFKAYIKQKLFKKIDWRTSFTVIIITLSLIFLYLGSKSKIWWLSFSPFFAAVIIFIVAFVDTSLFNYRLWKKYDYGKTALPNTYEEVKDKNKISFEVFEYVKGLEERVKKLEKDSPTRLGIFAFFLTTLLAIVLYLLPKILPH